MFQQLYFVTRLRRATKCKTSDSDISNFQGVNVILGLLLTLALGSYSLLLLVTSVESTADKCLS